MNYGAQMLVVFAVQVQPRFMPARILSQWNDPLRCEPIVQVLPWAEAILAAKASPADAVAASMSAFSTPVARTVTVLQTASAGPAQASAQKAMLTQATKVWAFNGGLRSNVMAGECNAGAGRDHSLEIASNSSVRILVLVVMQTSTALVVPVPPFQLMGTRPLQSASRNATQARWLARSAFSQLPES